MAKKKETNPEVVEEAIASDEVLEEAKEEKKSRKTQKAEPKEETLAKEETEKQDEPVEEEPEKVSHKKEKKKGTRFAPKKKRGSKKKVEETSDKEEFPEEVETLSEALEKTLPKRRRYTSRNTRRGRYHFAAWLGLVVILLAIIGVVALTVSMVSIIKKANEHTDIMLELYDEAYPLIQYQPKPFASLEEADQSLLLQSAIFRLNEMENVRRLREKSDEYSYKQDEYGRLIIPVETIDESFKTLYGSDIQPQHQTLGESGGKSYTFEYDKANACYYVPFSESSSLYTTIVDKCKYNRKNISIRVGYALTSDLDIDNHGNIVEPTASKIEYYQWYTFIKTNEDTWVLNSVENEE